MTAGLLAKTALFPLHLWLPPAHANAPAAASAVLSALVVKASFFLIVRLWFDVMPGLASQAVTTMLATLGAAAILFGSVLALRQARLKLLVAYSTVAQIGYLFLMFPLVAGGHPWSAEAWNGGVMQTLSHAFAKAAMFLAAGLVAEQLGHDRIAELRGIGRAMPMTVFAFGLGGLSLMGLPPSGGFAAKWLLLQASVESGQWAWAVIMLAGGLLAGGYRLSRDRPGAGQRKRRRRRRPRRGVARRWRWRWRSSRCCSVSRRKDSSTCCRSAGRSRWWLCNERRRHAGSRAAGCHPGDAAGAAAGLPVATPARQHAGAAGAGAAARSRRGASGDRRDAARRSISRSSRSAWRSTCRARSCWASRRCSGVRPASMPSPTCAARPNSARFAVCWLLTLTGSLGVFIAADLLGFYLVFALVSLPAYGLIAHDDDDDAAQRAGGVYMAFTRAGRGLPADGLRAARGRRAQRQPADPRRRGGTSAIAVARCSAWLHGRGLRAQDRARCRRMAGCR